MEIWLEAFGYDIHVTKTDEGVVVDVWADWANREGEPHASTYAFDQEREN